MLFLFAIVSGLLQLVSHLTVELYFPRLGKLPRYVIGTLCLMIPPSFAVGWVRALPFWFCVIASGLAVIGANWLGYEIREHQDKLAELERLRMYAETLEEE